jgi:hypothetical protein
MEEEPRFAPGLFAFGLSVSGAIGAVKFYELVVDAENEKGCGPLADEERHVVLLRDLVADGDGHRGKSSGEIDAGGNLGGDFFDSCGYLIFLNFTLTYAIVGH